MPGGDRLLNVMKQVNKRANPSTKNTDVVYGVVKKTNPLTILVDNRLELTEDFLILSPLCYAAGFDFKIGSHSHSVSVSKVSQEGHKHSVDGKETSEAGGINATPTASCESSGGHKVSVSLWGNLEQGDKLVMLRVAEGQAYMVLYRDKLNIKVQCQDL